jgi:hypothetical protein
MSDWARTPQGTFQTSRNEQFELDHDSCPRTKLGQARSRHEVVGSGGNSWAAAGKRRHRNREMEELKLPEEGDTRRDQELLTELAVVMKSFDTRDIDGGLRWR